MGSRLYSCAMPLPSRKRCGTGNSGALLSGQACGSFQAASPSELLLNDRLRELEQFRADTFRGANSTLIASLPTSCHPGLGFGVYPENQPGAEEFDKIKITATLKPIVCEGPSTLSQPPLAIRS
jgi:hypothetical protein